MTKIFLALIFSFFGSLTLAQTEGPSPCAADIEKFCKKELQAGENFVTCLQKNIDKASAACKAHDKKMREVLTIVPPLCHPDYQKNCTMAQTKSDIQKCLKEKKKNFSADCVKAIEAMK